MTGTPMAHTALGDLHGTWEGDVAVFRRVPYAAPPVGDLRFAPPQPPAAWSGLRDATEHGPVAPQMPAMIGHAMGDYSKPMGEDCLTLTIWTPAADAARRPVLVWLHGGAWQNGAGSLEWYSGAPLAGRGDIVVVGVNYRLGALGFLCHPAIAAGNMGVLDQIAALAWVRDHIAGFGGDPGCVTVAGQSAGANATAMLLTHSGPVAPFRRAGLISGSFGAGQPIAADLLPAAESFLRALDIDPDAADVAARARGVPMEALLAAQAQVSQHGRQLGRPGQAFVPIAPARQTAAERIAAIAKAAAGRDMLVGVTQEECHAFFPATAETPDIDDATLDAQFAGEPAGTLTAYRARRPGASNRDLVADLASDQRFLLPAVALLDALAAGGVQAHGYLFDWGAPGSLYKACHCIDLPFLLGTLPAWGEPRMLAGGNPRERAALSDVMQQAMIGFVREGVPAMQPDWPAYDSSRRQMMRFGSRIAASGAAAGLGWRIA
jgi:para-nitrobenzyl esterase